MNLDEKIMKYIPKKYKEAVEETEICSLDGYWVYLKEDYICKNTDSRTCRGDTIKDLLADIRTITRK